MIYEWFFDKPALTDNQTALAEAIIREIDDAQVADQILILTELLEKWPDISLNVNGHNGLDLEEFNHFFSESGVFYIQKIQSIFRTSEETAVRAEELLKYLSRHELVHEKIFILNLFFQLLTLTNRLSAAESVALVQHTFFINTINKNEVAQKYYEQVRNLLGILLVSRDFIWIATAVYHQLKSVKKFEDRASLLYYLMYLDIPDFSKIFSHIDFSQYYNSNGKEFLEKHHVEALKGLKPKIELIDKILNFLDYQEIKYLMGPLLHVVESDTTEIEQMVLLKHIMENTIAR